MSEFATANLSLYDPSRSSCSSANLTLAPIPSLGHPIAPPVQWQGYPVTVPPYPYPCPRVGYPCSPPPPHLWVGYSCPPPPPDAFGMSAFFPPPAIHHPLNACWSPPPVYGTPIPPPMTTNHPATSAPPFRSGNSLAGCMPCHLTKTRCASFFRPCARCTNRGTAKDCCEPVCFP
jgi:hypothetical protein